MTIENAYRRLKATTNARIRKNEPLSLHTTFKIGGPAALYIELDDVADIDKTLTVLSGEQVPWTFLGRGSNVLASDEGYEGAVLILGPKFRKYTIIDDSLIVAGAGAVLATVVRGAFSKGLSGLEFAVGIPGTVGGALAMNAGTRDEWIGKIVASVTLFVPRKGLVQIPGEEIPWAYRSSGLASKGLILESKLRVKPGDIKRIQSSMEASLRRRKKSQPLSLPNAGSIFVNPEGDSSGRLIEACGLKGHAIGGAQISTVHANFIVNTGSARASDVIDLIALARMKVKEVYSIELKPEIKFLGSF